MEPIRPAPKARERGGADLDGLLTLVGRRDQAAFEGLYDRVAAPVFGLIRRVLRDSAQSEEVTQETLLEVWRTADRFDPARGAALAWIMTIAHRRAVDRVRAEQASSARQEKMARASERVLPEEDVATAVEGRLEHQRLRRCMGGLTELQRESVTLAYYSGYTYQQVAELLGAPLGTVKTRMRDGLARLRDCLGVGR